LRFAVACTPATLATALFVACDDSAPRVPQRPAGLILEIDGLEVWQRDLEPLLRYVDSVDRRIGEKARVRAILGNHLIPLRLAQRAFAEQRSELRRRCAALHSAVGNEAYPGLVAKGKAVVGDRGAIHAGRQDLPLPVAAYVFDPANLGMMSPVLEVPQGFCLIAASDVLAGATRASDAVDAFQVGFYTHDPVTFGAWLRQAEREVATRLTYVNPDYKDSLPPWIVIPPADR